MSFMLGSVTTAPSWHGLWLRLIEDTTPARGALASALATRMAAPIARDPPQPLPPQTAQNTLKDLEAKTFQREEPPTKPMVDNIFDFTLARQALEKLTDTTPRVAYNINAEPQQRKHAMTTADGFKSHAVFAITDIFEAKVPISSNNERDDFPFDDIADMMAYEACPDIMDPLFPDWSDKAAIELYYQEKVIQDGIGDYIIKPGDPDYEDPDFPFNNVAELRFVADNFTSDDDEQVDNLLAYYRSGTTQ
jgi:hypothetical protein